MQVWRDDTRKRYIFEYFRKQLGLPSGRLQRRVFRYCRFFARSMYSNGRNSSHSLAQRKASRRAPTSSPPFVTLQSLSRTPKTLPSKRVTERRCNMNRNRIHKHPSDRPLYYVGMRRSNHSGSVSYLRKPLCDSQ